MQPEQQQRIMGYFIEEAKDHLNTIEQGLLNLQSTLDDPEMVNEVFRAAHSVKGGAAMLNLGGIQKTSHRLEDYFKILKETPGIRADQKLESLLLQVFDVLHNLLEQLQSPYGLTEESALAIAAEAEPTFQQIEQHLQTLIAAAGQVGAVSAPARGDDRSLAIVFQQHVPTQLREMLDLFRQAEANPDARQRLQGVCDRLQDLGAPFALDGWYHLVETVKRAIAYSENACRDLAPIVIKELKQAQEAIVGGRGDHIQVSDQLLQRVPLAAVEEGSSTLADDLFETEMDDLLADDLSGDLSFADDLDLGAETDLNADLGLDFDSAGDDLDFLSELNLVDLDEHADENTAGLEALGSDEAFLSLGDFASDSDGGSLADLEEEGPEMGMAELNSLADLFEGEVPDLNSTWQEEEVLQPGDTSLSEPSSSLSDSGADLADFLSVGEGDALGDLAGNDDELSSLFGDNLLDDLAPDTDPSLSDLAADLSDLGLSEDLSSDDRSSQTSADLGLDDLGLGVLDSIDADFAVTESSASELDFSDEFGSEGRDSASIEGLGDLFLGLEEDEGAALSLGDAKEVLDFNPDLDADLFLGLEEDEIDRSSSREALSLDADLQAISDVFGEADLGLPELEESENLNDPWAIGDATAESLNLEEQPLGESLLDSLELDDFESFGALSEPEALPEEPPMAADLLSNFSESPAAADSELMFAEDALEASLFEEPELGDIFSLDLEGSTDAGLLDDWTLLDTPVAGSSDLFLGLEAPGGSDTEVQIGDALLTEMALEEEAGSDRLDEWADFSELSDLDITDRLAGEDDAEFDLASLDLGSADIDATDLGAIDGLDLATDSVLELPDEADLLSLDDLDMTPLSLETLEEDASLDADADLLSLDDLDTTPLSLETIEEDDSLDAALSDHSSDLFELESTPFSDTATPDTPEATLDQLDLDSLDLDLDLDDRFPASLEEESPSYGASLEETSLGFGETLDLESDDFLGDLDLGAGETGNPDLSLEELSPWDDLEAAGLSAAGESEAAADLGNLEELGGELDAFDDLFSTDADSSIADLSEEPSEDRPLDNLDLLFGAGAAGAVGLGIAGAAAMGAFSDQAAAEADSLEGDFAEPLESDDFAELEALIAEDSPSETAAEPFSELEALLDTPEAGSRDTSDEAGQFADLEALLSSDRGASGDLGSSSYPEFDDLEKLLEEGDKTIGGSTPAGKSLGVTQARRPARPNKGFSEQTMRVPVKHLDNLSNLVGELVVNRNSLEQDQERLRQSLDNLLYQVQQLSDVGQRMQDLYERSLLESSLLASRQNYRVASTLSLQDAAGVDLSHKNEMEYDPLEMDRFTGFHSLSQEMIELIVRVRESASDIEFIVDETDQVTRMFRQVTTQLQEGLTRSRMVPFAQTADRLPRAVRDIAMKCGKQAELVIEGRETLIDKMILEHLYDPMTHLVNNAITHGIETPEERRRSGKSETGRILIRAFHQGNQTVISVADDGAGIDVDRVKRKAIEKGLITAAEAQTMSRLDVYDLLFHPGFSTRDKADDFAGRGVGMDVVRTSLSEIRGAINTDSTHGKGTVFTIRLPLTLSISKALCCISDRARIAFPMDGVEDMLDLPKERVQTTADGHPAIAWRDTLLPLRPLTELLAHNRHLSRGSVYGGNQEEDMISVVVLRSAGNYLALQVDQVLGEQEIVIKQLEGPVPKPVGIAGATVLGDGRIMPIADVLELIDLSVGRIRRDAGSMWDQGGQSVPEPAPSKSEPTVLIVDDSITVRELLSMTFNKVGYRVEQARDGQEAWEKLRSGLPCDIVFCDIEMPRMDGLELLSRIQKDPALKNLPIAMLTSRGADRHRQMAVSLGASGYFTKPYLEEALLDAAQRMLKGEILISSRE